MKAKVLTPILNVSDIAASLAWFEIGLAAVLGLGNAADVWSG